MVDSKGDTPARPDDVAAARHLVESYGRLRAELGKVIVGQRGVLEELLVAMLSRGHCILEGVPGLAKTLLISTVARTMDLSFSRIQFTPDLMPSDITGTEVIEEDKRSGGKSMRFVEGPIFANVILADEINRTPPKTQSALLEAMQERQVSAGGVTRIVPEPFFVLATQNPIEQEGTYPLPEAQLDRFMFKILVDYPSAQEEMDIVRLTTGSTAAVIDRVMDAEGLLSMQETVRRVPCSDHVIGYAMALARTSRPRRGDAPKFVEDYVAWGAGPRASQQLVLAGKARALIHGRHCVSTDDIRAVAPPVLRHRIITSFNAEADGVTSDQVVRLLLDHVPRDASETIDDSLARRVFAAPGSS
ncbi:MAG: MoxR family ATPase [Phycisphaerales bacterium]|nr:MoxR family ATPase [Phycisphaerales bacterium]